MHPLVGTADLPDQHVPDGLAEDDVLGGLVHLGKADDGVGVKEREKVLQQLGALPELFLGLT